MPPMRIETETEDKNYGNPFVGGLDHVDHVKVDVSLLTTDEVDADGYLKPGVCFAKDGTPVGAAPDYVYGVTPEAIKIVGKNPTNVSLAADTSDPLIGVGIAGLVNKDIIEGNLGRALTANELAGFDRAGSKLHITR